MEFKKQNENLSLGTRNNWIVETNDSFKSEVSQKNNK